jgi:hypothetical protein
LVYFSEAVDLVTRNSGNGLKPGCASLAGKSRVSARTSERHHQRRERQGTTWPVSSFCPKPKRKRNFQRACPADQAVGFLEYRYNASRRDPARYETLRARLEREVPDSRRAPGELHANTARQLLSVLVSVPNVADAVRQSERLGFAAGEERYMKDLGE